MAENFVGEVTDVGSRVPDINNYWFTGAGATLSGIFIDGNGIFVGSFSTALNANGGTPKQLSNAIPTTAVGALVNIAGGAVSCSIYPAGNAAAIADFATNVGRYPIFASGGNNLPFGRMAL